MRSSHHHGETGSSLLMLIGALTFILALAGAVSLVTANGLKASSRSSDGMVAFYAADAAAQVGNALVRSTGLSMQATTLQETIGGHPVNVAVTEEAAGLYKVTSTSDVNGEVSTVELWVNFTTEEFDVAPQGGFETSIGDGVALNGDFRVDLSDDARISGYDHDSSGNELDDQTDAVPALAVHPTPGDRDFNINTLHGSEVVGPQASVNNAEDRGDLMNTLRDIAQASADVFVTGTTALDETANGNYGTAADPVLVYVNLGQNDELQLEGSFQGYGFMIIDAGKNAEFEMADFAQWNGMILVRTHGDPSSGNGPIVGMEGHSKVIGSVQMMMDINGTHANGHKLLGLEDDAQILFSSSLINEIFHGDEDTEAVPLSQASSVTTFRG